VDDDDNIRMVASIGLEDVPDWQILEASSGQQALAMAQTEHLDLILLDMMMPGMDGVTTLKNLRSGELTKDIPVIFMTAKVQTHEIESYKNLGALGVITKPFDPITLADEINSILSNPAAVE
jgi:CheY-like chemotaxis protein